MDQNCRLVGATGAVTLVDLTAACPRSERIPWVPSVLGMLPIRGLTGRMIAFKATPAKPPKPLTAKPRAIGARCEVVEVAWDFTMRPWMCSVCLVGRCSMIWFRLTGLAVCLFSVCFQWTPTWLLSTRPESPWIELYNAFLGLSTPLTKEM